MDKSYKTRKEDFVSNLSGGDLLEINLVTLVAPAAVLLWSALQSRRSFFVAYGGVPFATDFLLNVGAILFAITAYSSIPLLLNVLLVTPALFISWSSKPSGQKKAKPPAAKEMQKDTTKASSASLPIRPFLTTYRGSMMIITCLAILAVDFKIFPRRFAKAENWGTSLMDLGVGSFVFSGGVVSARAIATTFDKKGKVQPLLRRMLAASRHAIPLFILGFIRLYSVKGLDYAEHVTEYGVHWNFFFTLGLLAPFVEVFHSVATTIIPSYEILAVVLALAYELVLDNTALKAYILISPRGDSLLSKNREGIFSFLGYLAIFLAGRGTGLVVIPEHKSRDQDTSKTTQAGDSPSSASSRRRALIRDLCVRSVVWWSLYLISTMPHIFLPPIPSSWTTTVPHIDIGLGIGVSRRMANLPYVLWVTAFNTSQILLFCLIETYHFPSVHLSYQPSEAERATPQIMKSFNRNGLPIFLVANLLTGLVNLSINTLDMGILGSMGVLIAYAAAVTGVAVGLEWAGIKIKL